MKTHQEKLDARRSSWEQSSDLESLLLPLPSLSCSFCQVETIMLDFHYINVWVQLIFFFLWMLSVIVSHRTIYCSNTVYFHTLGVKQTRFLRCTSQMGSLSILSLFETHQSQYQRKNANFYYIVLLGHPHVRSWRRCRIFFCTI